jgi:predicted nucleotidyltransferase
MNVTQLKDSGHIILSVLAGSHMYGLNVAGSDRDVRGIFNLPLEKYIYPDHSKQVNDATNDTVYYEIVRFLELAKQSNPNILEILFAPEKSILWESPTANRILKHKYKFLTKAAKNSLCGYAVAQIKKARGQNKMIVNPIVERKDILDFCYVLTPHGTVPVKIFIDNIYPARDQSWFGVSKANNARDMYYIYCDTVDREYRFKGMVNEDLSSNELRLSSIPKEATTKQDMVLMSFNKDGYTSHCLDYKKYQNWVKNRNPARYTTNKNHGQDYDSKNLMHCFRLLNMGKELATEGTLNVFRKDRDFLLKIRRGEFKYDYLIDKADELVKEVDEAFDNCSLPTCVSDTLVKEIIAEFKLPW